MLRAIRFSNRFNFDIEEKTKAALSKNAEKISLISIERIRDEITRIIAERNNPGKGMMSLSDFGLLKDIIPEIEDLKNVEQPEEFHPEGDVFVHTCLVLDMLDYNEKDKDKWLEINKKYSNLWPNISKKKEPPKDSEEYKKVKNKFEKFFSEIPGV